MRLRLQRLSFKISCLEIIYPLICLLAEKLFSTYWSKKVDFLHLLFRFLIHKSVLFCCLLFMSLGHKLPSRCLFKKLNLLSGTHLHLLFCTVIYKKRGTLLLPISSLIIDRFLTFFTGTLCRQFAIMWLLYILPHYNCIFTLPYEIQM